MNKYDPVEQPQHYMLDKENGLEVKHVMRFICIKLLSDRPKSFVLHVMYEYLNAIKYILRAPFKSNVVEDFKKAGESIRNIIKYHEKIKKDSINPYSINPFS